MAFLNNAGVQRLWAHILSRLDLKVDKVEGKGLSTEDFTTEEKEKLAILRESVQADWNQIDEASLDYIKNKPDENDALTLLAEIGFIDPVIATDGSVFTDSNGALYTL